MYYNRLEVEFAKSSKQFIAISVGSLALIHLINKTTSQHETTVGVFLGLSKAFDTVDHQILFGKLELYRICGAALQ